MKKNKQPPNNQIAIYQSPDGGVNIEVLYANENIWLTQKLIAQLFECSIDNVSLHLKNIFAEGELDPESVIEEYSITANVLGLCGDAGGKGPGHDYERLGGEAQCFSQIQRIRNFNQRRLNQT